MKDKYRIYRKTLRTRSPLKETPKTVIEDARETEFEECVLDEAEAAAREAS